jgi:hypothetical protein
MARRALKFSVCLVVLQSVTSEAMAGPFCAVFSWGKECYFFDMESCEQAAGTAGACIVNQDEAQPPSPGGAPFCVVQSYGTNCWYYDAAQCEQAAESSGGACVVNGSR